MRVATSKSCKVETSELKLASHVIDILGAFARHFCINTESLHLKGSTELYFVMQILKFIAGAFLTSCYTM